MFWRSGRAAKSRRRLTFQTESSYKPRTFSSGGLARVQPLAQIVSLNALASFAEANSKKGRTPRY
jgi:hypothetical protein